MASRPMKGLPVGKNESTRFGRSLRAGCHINQPIPELIQDGGFSIDSMDRLSTWYAQSAWV